MSQYVEPVTLPVWWRSADVARWVSMGAAVLALLICIGQLRMDGALFGIDEYDDGVYLGGAIRLAHGSLLYRDFAFPHPPGIPLLFLPLALIGRIGSTRTLMAMARILTAFIAAGNVWLLGRLLRSRGAIAVGAASLALAVFPLASHANKTLLIEPYVVFFSLLGVCLLFVGEEVTTGRRALLAGIVLGFAIAVKLWAVLPLVGVGAACWGLWRSRWRHVLGGIAAGAIFPSLPFFLASPGPFIRQVFLLQLQRGASEEVASSGDRLVYTVGLRAAREVGGAAQTAAVLGLLFVALVVASYVLRARLRPLDRFAIVAAAVSLAAVFKSADYFPHYSYFTAAFLGLLGGAALGSLLEAVQTMTAAAPSPSGGTSAGRSWTARVLAVALAPTLAVGVCIGGVIGYVRGESIVDRYPGVITVGDFGPGVAAAVPRGACVLTDEPALTITANRFVSSRPCPDVVDPFYVWLSEDPKRVPPAGPPYDPDLVAKWRDWLSQADYVVLSGYPFRIPWSGELGAWFRSNFEAVAEPGPVVYRRIDGQVP